MYSGNSGQMTWVQSAASQTPRASLSSGQDFRSIKRARVEREQGQWESVCKQSEWACPWLPREPAGVGKGGGLEIVGAATLPPLTRKDTSREGGSRRCCAGSRCCRFRQTERLIAMPVNLIAEDKGEGNGVCKIDEEGTRSRKRVQGGTESPCFSIANAASVMQYRSGAV